MYLQQEQKIKLHRLKGQSQGNDIPLPGLPIPYLNISYKSVVNY